MDNLKIYNSVREVPEEAKKLIQAGNIKGFTDINPMWRIKTLTEQFGPCGFGWYSEITKQWLEAGEDGKVAAFCNINLYVKWGGEWSKPIQGTGGSAFVNLFKGSPATSDEAYKMAYTDAISVACKSLGIGADVYWNKDQTKYSEQETNPPASGVMISTIQKAMESLEITEKQLFYNLGVRSWDEIGTQEFKVAMEKFEAEKKKRGIA